jgi:hypothetical protein
MIMKYRLYDPQADSWGMIDRNNKIVFVAEKINGSLLTKVEWAQRINKIFNAGLQTTDWEIMLDH